MAYRLYGWIILCHTLIFLPSLNSSRVNHKQVMYHVLPRLCNPVSLPMCPRLHLHTHTHTHTHTYTHTHTHTCTNTYTYTLTLIQVHPEQLLGLKEFACRNVTVSFVVVNQYGASHESPTLSLTVPAGAYFSNILAKIIVFLILSRSYIDPVSIGAPTDVAVSTEVDKRPGFFGHAVLTVSWQHPPGTYNNIIINVKLTIGQIITSWCFGCFFFFCI